MVNMKDSKEILPWFALYVLLSFFGFCLFRYFQTGSQGHPVATAYSDFWGYFAVGAIQLFQVYYLRKTLKETQFATQKATDRYDEEIKRKRDDYILSIFEGELNSYSELLSENQVQQCLASLTNKFDHIGTSTSVSEIQYALASAYKYGNDKILFKVDQILIILGTFYARLSSESQYFIIERLKGYLKPEILFILKTGRTQLNQSGYSILIGNSIFQSPFERPNVLKNKEVETYLFKID